MAAHLVLVGNRYCGVVDHAPGLFYVATEFLHINHIPVAPVQSYLIRADGRGKRAIRLQPKSVLLGYVRGLSSVACVLLTLAGCLMAGMCAVVAATCLNLDPSATEQRGGVALQPLDLAFVGGIALGAALAIAILIARAYTLTEWPRPGRNHPAARRLLWQLAITVFVIALAAGQLAAALDAHDMTQGRTAVMLSFLPIVACVCLGAAELLSYGYRLTLLWTPARYERALDLAPELGIPHQLVDEQYYK